MLTVEKLTKRSEYLAVSAVGSKYVSASFIALFRFLPQESEKIRIGYTTSRKLGNAVTRNKIRRRIKEAFRLTTKKDLPFSYSCEVVLIGRPPAKDVDFTLLLREMEKAFSFIQRKGQKT